MLSIRRSLPPAVPLRCLWRASDWPNASLYCIVSRAVHLEPARSAALYQANDQTTRCTLLLRKMSGQGGALVDHLAGERIADVQYRLGCDYTSMRRQMLLCDELRYCPRCLMVGYHSTVFQSLCLGHCPEHQCVLATRCPACRNPIVPTLKSAAADPFACPKCQKCFISSILAERNGEALRGLDARLGVLRRSLGPQPSILNSACVHPSDLKADSAESSKTARRFSVWVGGSDWGMFREEALVEDHQPNDLNEVDANEAAVEALRGLHLACVEHWQDLQKLGRRLRLNDSGVRLDGRASAVAAAFMKTVHLFRADRVDLGTPQWMSWWSSGDAGTYSFPGSIPVGATTRSSARLRELEVLGLFAQNLVEAGRARHLSEIRWAPTRRSSRFLPSWCRQRATNGKVVIRIRHRVNEHSVVRLIKRYQSHILQPDDKE